MSQEYVGTPTLDLGLDRFKHGNCPSCGKSKGEPKGLEYRSRSADLFCHTCKKRWPIELNLADLQREFSRSQARETDARTYEGTNLAPTIQNAEVDTGTRGLRRIFRRIVFRR